MVRKKNSDPLRHAAVCFSMLRVCCGMLWCAAACWGKPWHAAAWCSMLQYAAGVCLCEHVRVRYMNF